MSSRGEPDLNTTNTLIATETKRFTTPWVGPMNIKLFGCPGVLRGWNRAAVLLEIQQYEGFIVDDRWLRWCTNPLLTGDNI